MLRLVFFAILLIFVARSLRSLWGGIVEGLNQPAKRNSGVPARGVHMVRDPVCGTFVVPERAVSLTVGRELLHFCSVACRDAYRTRPAARSDRPEGRTA
jgi:YHS domain-containing protein